MKKLALLISIVTLFSMTLIGCSDKNTDQADALIKSNPTVQAATATEEIDNQNILRDITLTDTDNGKTGNDEISLNDEYMQAVSNEPYLDEKDILASINRRFFEIYSYGSERANAYCLSSLMDPHTFEWAREIKSELDGLTNLEDKVRALRRWMSMNLVHTQSGFFSGMPGSDPWGITDVYPYNPAFKAEAPSEMKALSIYTGGKNTAKCNGLALTNADIMLLLGVSPDDIMQFILDTEEGKHVICFAKFEGKILYFNNTGLSILGEEGLLTINHATGIFNYSTNQDKVFDLTGKFYNDDESLIESVFKYARLSDEALGNRVDILYQFQNRDDLVSTILLNEEKSELFALTKYAYQSLYVKRPEIYLLASLKTSRAKELADELKSPEKIFEWIKKNISTGSIFEDSQDRIMTADEVIACKTGGLKDQAVLAFTLLEDEGINSAIDICKENVYITFDDKMYEVNDWKQVEEINDEVILQLKIK